MDQDSLPIQELKQEHKNQVKLTQKPILNNKPKDRNSKTQHIAFIPIEDETKTARTTNLHRLKLNISAANERGHHKEVIAPIESENKQVEQKWVIWNEGKMDLCG